MKKSLLATLLLFSTFLSGIGQEKEKGFQFTTIKDLPVTPVKNQHRSGTCWSFAGASFIESELLRMGKPEVDLSEMFLVNNCYNAKADRYIRMQGNANFGPGGLLHDILFVMKTNGLVPESAYSGLEYGEKNHVHGEIDGILRSYVEATAKNQNKKLSPAWKKGFNAVTESYLGKTPEKFDYEGKSYTPATFLSEYCNGLNADDYIEITSFMHHPFYQSFVLEVPDNWLWGSLYNVPLADLTEIISNAIDKGYTVGWAADVSEKGFSTSQKGIAIVPDINREEMSDAEIGKWEKMSDSQKEYELYKFDKPGVEKKITQEMRQAAFDNLETTDDHAMHIVGTAKDQNGNLYYKVKNSWGAYNSMNGFFYASVPYVQYKTTAILVHKNAIPQPIRKKLGL